MVARCPDVTGTVRQSLPVHNSTCRHLSFHLQRTHSPHVGLTCLQSRTLQPFTVQPLAQDMHNGRYSIDHFFLVHHFNSLLWAILAC
jgi:hypothetical protein